MGKGNIKRRLRVFLILMPIVVGFVALCIGRYMVEPKQVIDVLTNQFLGFPEIVEDIDLSVVWKIRLPRIFLSMLVGMGLAVSGAAFQGLFSNPLATPDTLGVAAAVSYTHLTLPTN